ncbi:MAG: hypothetical protein WCB85_14810 [Candidatus Dormiibacterota bacterium]
MLRAYRHTVTIGLLFTIPLDVMAAILVFFGFRDRLAVLLVIGILIIVLAAIIFGVQVAARRCIKPVRQGCLGAPAPGRPVEPLHRPPPDTGTPPENLGLPTISPA